MDEVNDNGQLAGFDRAKLMTVHEQMALIAVAAAKVADAAEKTPSKGSRADFFKYGGDIEDEIFKKIKAGKLQVDDAEILVTTLMSTAAGKTTTSLFESGDVIKEGLKSLKGGETAKDFNMMLSRIEVTAATVAVAGTDATEAEILAAEFRGLHLIPSLRNAVFNLKVGNRIVFLGKSLNGFYNRDNTNHTHTVELDNPKFVRENEKIEAQIIMLDGSGVPLHTYLRVTLRGSGTSPKSN